MRSASLYVTILLVLPLAVACGGQPPSHLGDADGGASLYPQSLQREVDLLFVIDNSSSMAGEQANWRTSFSPLSAFKNMFGGLPDLHLGVVSTDLGTGSFPLGSCDALGDEGRLLTSNCANPVGAPYLVDVSPRGCDITREINNTCTASDCGPEHCAHEPSTTFVVDSNTGCPRCRNYSNESLEDVFSCLADLGTSGCDFEQPLEAVYRALEPSNDHNAGFLRDESLLGIMIISDEDDCSATSDQLYDPNLDADDGPLGPYASFRCFDHGIICDVNGRYATGLRQGCVPREDDSSMLHPVSRYVSFLDGLKDPQLVTVAVLGGALIPSSPGPGFDVDVQLDDNSNPMVQWSCTTAVDGASPGIRLHSLASAFNEPDELEAWAYSSVCQADLTPAFAGIGHAMSAHLGPACLPAPLKGCADPGVEFGTPRAAQTCGVNAACVPSCQVTDIQEKGQPTEVRVTVPPCLEVMPDGTMAPGNTDRSLAYADGHPNQRDAALPVEACWHISYQELCQDSNYAELIISRQSDPPSRTFAAVACEHIPLDEQQCGDGADNDEDCLVDMDDPCCQNPANCNSTN